MDTTTPARWTAAIPLCTEPWSLPRHGRGSIAGTAPTMVTFSVFRLILCHALAGVAGCTHFLLPFLLSLTPLSTASSLFVHTLFLLFLPYFPSGLACLFACLHANFLTMLMTHHKKKSHGGELCLSIHQGGTQVRETWLRDAFLWIGYDCMGYGGGLLRMGRSP